MSLSTTDEEHGYLRIRKEDIPVRTLWLEQGKLRFFVDNPRIYSLVRTDDAEPDQDDIYKELLQLEHVKELKEDIKLNGGLIDPLIVRDGTFEVLEGNSRLAACRWLYKNDDPIAWAVVKCTLLPADIDERLVFALLGQYHIKGKKDWIPYEKAGFLHRRFRYHKEDIPTVASEFGLTTTEATHLIRVYDFMLKHKAERDQWSYFDELLKSKKIKTAREQFPTFDDLVVQKIQSGEIKRAVDVRDDLPAICVGPAKNLKRFVEGKLTFEEAHEIAIDAGGENPDYKKLFKFRQWLAPEDTEKDLLGTQKNVRDKIEFELDKIAKRTRQLHSRLTGKVHSSK